MMHHSQLCHEIKKKNSELIAQMIHPNVLKKGIKSLYWLQLYSSKIKNNLIKEQNKTHYF